MKTGFFKKLCTIIVTAVVAVCSLGVVSFATDTTDTGTIVITNADDLKSIRKWWLNTDTYDAKGDTTKGKEQISLDKNGYYTARYDSDGSSNGKFKSVTITLPTSSDSSSTWGEIETAEQNKASQEMLMTISGWSLSSASQKKVTQKLINNPDIPFDNADAVAALFNQGADITGAMGWFAPFSGPVGIILGIGVVIIMVLLIFSTIMDLVYIGIPMAQVAMQKAAGEAGKDAPFGVSVDAVKVVAEKADSGKGGGNVYLQYFKRRILTYIILALCILYLVSGSLGGLISGLLNTVSGITG